MSSTQRSSSVDDAADRRAVDALCDRFEQAWQTGTKPDFASWVPPGGPLRSSALVELALLDLDYRLRAGEPAGADNYLDRYPELRADLEAVNRLRVAEARFRRGGPPQRDTETWSPPQLEEQIDVTTLLAPPQGEGELGRLGQYRVLKVIGQGGMGMVLLAEDLHLLRSAALKIMLPKYAKNAQARERFLREARAAAGVRHDKIVTIFQVGEQRGVSFIAMEYLKGSSLQQYLNEKSDLTVGQAVRIGRDIAEGLQAAHANGLIHRDIKPANIWLEAPHGRVKILDFGLARPEKDNAHLTQSGAVVGTPAFMSPEQASGQAVDSRSDLFSLGVVLYRLCTGKQPFTGSNTFAVLTSLSMDMPRPPQLLNSAVPADLSDLIMQQLAKDPSQRPASALAVAERLSQIKRRLTPPQHKMVETDLVSAPVSPQHKHEPKSVTAPKRRHALIAAAVTLLLLGPLAYFFSGPVIRFATNKGELKIEIADQDIEVRIIQNGVVIEDKTTKRQFTITAGKGEIEAWEKGGHQLTTKEFKLTRGGRTAVTVTLEELAEARKPKPPSDPRPTPLGDDNDRRAAEYVLSIGGKVRVNDQERGISAAAQLPTEPFRLTFVYLNENKQVTDAGLAHFKDCKSLAQLHLFRARVTDAGLAHFKDCPNLKTLDISGTRMTDAGLNTLKDCKNLRELYVRKTKVSAKALAEFHAAAPACTIEHDGGIIKAVTVNPSHRALAMRRLRIRPIGMRLEDGREVPVRKNSAVPTAYHGTMIGMNL